MGPGSRQVACPPPSLLFSLLSPPHCKCHARTRRGALGMAPNPGDLLASSPPHFSAPSTARLCPIVRAAHVHGPRTARARPVRERALEHWRWRTCGWATATGGSLPPSPHCSRPHAARLHWWGWWPAQSTPRSHPGHKYDIINICMMHAICYIRARASEHSEMAKEIRCRAPISLCSLALRFISSMSPSSSRSSSSATHAWARTGCTALNWGGGRCPWMVMADGCETVNGSQSALQRHARLDTEMKMKKGQGEMGKDTVGRGEACPRRPPAAPPAPRTLGHARVQQMRSQRGGGCKIPRTHTWPGLPAYLARLARLARLRLARHGV